MSASTHHLSVKVKLGCGCEFEQRIAGEDLLHLAEHRADELEMELPAGFDFPSGMANLFGMVECLQDQLLLALIMSGGHAHSGNESIDISVRTKVGELPNPEDWRQVS